MRWLEETSPRGTHNGDLPHDLALCAVDQQTSLQIALVPKWRRTKCTRADAPPLVFFDMNPLLLSSNQLHFGWVAVLVRLADIEAALS